jgi:CRP/FNR family transcriptional regulator, cyclic AMP receptor protein
MVLERNQTNHNAASSMDTIHYRPGAVILYPGKAENLYRVKNGLIRLHTMDDDGNGLTLRYVKPGEYFGEEAIGTLEREYFAEAVTDSSVEMFNPKNLSGEQMLDFAQALAKALRRGYQSIYRLAGKRLRSRIAAELLELADTALGSIKPDGLSLVYATHDELAAAVGSVRETVTKVVGELSKEGVIDSGYGKITLVNVPALRAIANA